MEVISVESIRNKNDFLRQNLVYLTRYGELCLSQMVSRLSEEKRHELLKKVSDFSDFNEDNDPYKEHDFGAVEQDGERYFFKFEYLSQDNNHFSQVGKRRLHVMKASEY